ncbi:MAG: hypothetical protein H0W08_10340, partial [Acidobacteria bacterium]|nr:hypothetical protein [Acidobacteriota bacterium]
MPSTRRSLFLLSPYAYVRVAFCAILLAFALPHSDPAAQGNHPIADAPGAQPNRAVFS